MTTPTLDRYIERTPGVSGGKVRIAGRRITVADIAIWYERLGRSADGAHELRDVYRSRSVSEIAYTW